MLSGRAVAALLLLAPLAACQGASPTDGSTSRRCSVERAAELPVRVERGFLLVSGAIDQNPVFLLVDTGSERSMVTPDAVSRWRLDEDLRRRTTLHGIGGQVTTSNAHVPDFAVGRMELLDQSMAVGQLPSVGSLDPPVAGLLGADFLSDFDLDLDVPHRKITLYRVLDCNDDFTPWPQVAAVVPMRRLAKSLLAIDVQVDAQPVSALIDTGARASVITAQTAQRVGIGSDALAVDPSMSNVGVDSNTVAGHLHRFSELQIGRQTFHDVRLGVAPLNLRDTEMLLGTDYLRGHHVWLSYATHRLFLAPAGT
jgi:predicted aspartyl protease